MLLDIIFTICHYLHALYDFFQPWIQETFWRLCWLLLFMQWLEMKSLNWNSKMWKHHRSNIQLVCCYDTFIIWNNSCDWINWFSELNSKSRSVRFSCDLIHWKDPTQKIHSQISHLNTRRHVARFSVNDALKLVNELIVRTTTCIALVEQSSEKKRKKRKK